MYDTIASGPWWPTVAHLSLLIKGSVACENSVFEFRSLLPEPTVDNAICMYELRKLCSFVERCVYRHSHVPIYCVVNGTREINTFAKV